MATIAAIRTESIPPVTVDEWRELSREQYRSFVDELKALTDDDWDRPTDCDLWSVKDIVAHIVGWAEALVSPREAAHQMRGSLKYRKEMGDILNAQNQFQVEERRSLPPGELLNRLERVYPKFLTFRRFTGANAARAVPFGYVQVGFTNLSYLMNTIYTRDMLAHRIDIARAAGNDLKRTMVEDRIVEDCVKEWAHRTKAQMTVTLDGVASGTYIAGSGDVASVRTNGLELARVFSGRGAAEALDIEGDRARAIEWLSVGCPF